MDQTFQIAFKKLVFDEEYNANQKKLPMKYLSYYFHLSIHHYYLIHTIHLIRAEKFQMQQSQYCQLLFATQFVLNK